MTLVDEVLQLLEEEQRIALIVLSPAGVGTLVTGRPVGDGLHQQGVVVAVYGHAYQIKEVAAGLTLRPEAVTAPAPEGDLPGEHRLVEGLFVHIAEHQHVLGVGILDDCRHQPAAFLKIYFHHLI